MLRLDTWALVCPDAGDAMGKGKPPNRVWLGGLSAIRRVSSHP